MRQPEALDDHTAVIRQLHGMVRLGNEVANGGFSQFFFNGGGVCVDDAIAGFAAAGLPDHSAVADAAATAGAARIDDLRTALQAGTLEAYATWADGSGLDGFDDQWYALPDIDDAPRPLRGRPRRRDLGAMTGGGDPMIVTRWAEHRPDDHRDRPPIDLVIRTASPDDCPVIATLEHIRGDVTLDEGERRCGRQVDDPAVQLLVAEVGGRRSGSHALPASSRRRIRHRTSRRRAGTCFGVVVEDRWRRHGIGRALTLARLDWIRERATDAWYFTNAQNQVSLDLHADLGFEEVTRAFTIPGTTFEGGVGVLCRATLPR